MRIVTLVAACVFLGLSLTTSVFASERVNPLTHYEEDVEIASRGQKIRARVLKPLKPAGSVVLIAGGHGNLNISADGKIGWGRRNQVVRTRANYMNAGYVAIVPDIAPDLKRGKKAVKRYRWSKRHAKDLGAVIAYARSLAEPVYLIGTSRGALSVFNEVTRQSGKELPDAIVVTSGMLVRVKSKKPSVQRNVNGLADVKLPVLLIYHKNDACPLTPPSSAKKFKPLLKSSVGVDIKILSGGGGKYGHPCKARSAHGFLGMDDVVVKTITDWLKSVRNP